MNNSIRLILLISFLFSYCTYIDPYASYVVFYSRESYSIQKVQYFCRYVTEILFLFSRAVGLEIFFSLPGFQTFHSP